MPKRWRKPTDAELRREYEGWCEGPGPEEARRHLYELGFKEGQERERLKRAGRKKPSAKPEASK